MSLEALEKNAYHQDGVKNVKISKRCSGTDSSLLHFSVVQEIEVVKYNRNPSMYPKQQAVLALALETIH